MKLSDIKPLREDALESKTAEDLWSENGDSSAQYVSTMTYLVRAIPKTSPTMFETFSVVGDTKKPYGKFTTDELTKTLKPIRPNQTPDAEGFTTYVDPIKVDAFQYDGDPIKVEIADGKSVQLNKGDYVVRSVDGSNFSYSTESASDFESTLKKA